MKCIPALLLLIAIVGCINIVTPTVNGAPTNVVINPGFETADSPTSAWGGSRDDGAGRYHSGSWSGWKYSGTLEQNFDSLDTNGISEFSFWNGYTYHNYYYVYFDYAVGDSTAVYNLSNSTWTQIDLTAYIEPDRLLTGIRFWSGSDGDVYWDDVVLMYDPNVAPTITSSVITGINDGDNVYAMKYYDFTTIINDDNGASDIKAISVRGAQGASVRWMVNATSLDGTPSYTIITGANVIDLNTGGCLFSELDNVGTLYLTIRQEWDATIEDNCEIEVWARDVTGASVGWTTVQTNYYDVLNRVLTIGPYASAPSVPAGSNLAISGTLAYAVAMNSNTTSDTYPPTGAITSITVYDQLNKAWGTDTTVVNGAYSVSFNTTGANPTSTFRIYVDGSANYTDAYTPDKRTVTVTIQNFYAFNLLQIIADLLGIANFITPLTDALTDLGIYFATALGNAVSILVQMMRIIGMIALSIIYWLTLIVTTIISVVTTIGNIMNGTLFASAIGLPISDIWAYIGFGTWAPLLVLLLLIYWWDSLIPRAKRTGQNVYQVMIGDFQTSMYLVDLVYGWGMNVFNFVYGVVTWVAGLLASGLSL